MPAESKNGATSAPARSILPPYVVLRDFLGADAVRGLLEHALAHEPEFAATRTQHGEIRPAVRNSLGLRDLGRFRPALEAKVLGALPALIAALRVSAIESPRLEVQLVAHGDGAFYKRHIDTRTASDQQRLRVLSGVYYFHAEPKAFGGGALRLFAIGPNAADYVDIEPARDSLLVFPSWAPHEVMPVSCPSRRFIDSRFAINCWVRSKNARAQAEAPA